MVEWGFTWAVEGERYAVVFPIPRHSEYDSTFGLIKPILFRTGFNAERVFTETDSPWV